MLRQLYGTLDNFLPGDFYSAYTLSKKEHIGTVSKGRAKAVLKDNGYNRLYVLSALKKHPQTGAADNGSYRKVDPHGERWQYHVHLFNRGTQVAVFSHYEYRPDIHPIGDESLKEVYQRLQEHYRPKYGKTYVRGATDLEL